METFKFTTIWEKSDRRILQSSYGFSYNSLGKLIYCIKSQTISLFLNFLISQFLFLILINLKLLGYTCFVDCSAMDQNPVTK